MCEAQDFSALASNLKVTVVHLELLIINLFEAILWLSSTCFDKQVGCNREGASWFTRLFISMVA
jgi:hypothetical protein